MAEETDFLKKMQGVYAAQSADAKRTLNSLLFEYEPALAQFPALRQEVQRAVEGEDDLDIAIIVERLRPALQTASRLAVEIDTLDEAVRRHPEMDKLIGQAQTRLAAASAGVYADKVLALAEKLAQAAQKPAATPEPSAPPPPEPLSGDAKTFAQAEDLFFGDNGQKQDFVQAAVLYQRLAAKKHPGALARLAWMYATGKGVKCERAKYVDFLRQAAEAGHPDSMAELAELYREGDDDENGIPQNFDQAKFWAMRAHDAGARRSGWALGKLYADEKFLEFNPLVALGYFQEGSEAGCSFASFRLGLMYKTGDHIPKDMEKAIASFELSVRQGVRQDGADDLVEGIEQLVEIYEFGDGVAANPQKALEWYHRSGATKGNIANIIGWRYIFRKNENKALAWFEESVSQNNIDAMVRLAGMLCQSGPKQNLAQAEKWYLKAAELAPDEAWHAENLGNFYAKDGPKQNLAQAERWYLKAAELVPESKSYAQKLGAFYSENGPKQNLAQAERWYLKAAELDPDDARCAKELGDFYSDNGPKQNLAQAERWYLKAAELDPDDEWYAKKLGDFYSENGPKQDLAQAERWYLKAAELDPDNVRCAKELGDFYSENGPKQNLAQAEKWYMKASELASSDAVCAYMLGNYYSLDETRQSLALAERWYLKAAELAPYTAWCARKLGDFYSKDGPQKNLAQAEKWYLKVKTLEN